MKIYNKGKKHWRSNWTLLLALGLLMLMFLTACETVNSKPCPPYPIGGEKVANELSKVCYDKDGKNVCPVTFDWLSRLYVLKQQLKTCR